MDMICQAIGNDVIGEILDVISGTGFCASAAIARYAENGGLAAKMREERCDTYLSCCSIAARV